MASKKIASFGSWVSNITPEVFSQGNCKGITELLTNKDGVFYVEQGFAGRKELYFQGEGDRQRWAPDQSVQTSVHEYGGGSFGIIPGGGVVYSTNDGLYEQLAPTAPPTLLASGEKGKKRFADFSVTPSHVFCVHEVHKGEHEVDNLLISIDRKTKKHEIVASGADFYAYPRVSHDGSKISWMEWNDINMPWDETTIKVGRITEEGAVREHEVIKSGVGKNINYQCGTWSPNGSLYLSHDASGQWNLYSIDMNDPERIETNLYPSTEEIGYPLWQFGDSRFATNGDVTVFRMGSQIMVHSDRTVRSLEIESFTVFSHINLVGNNTVYCIAYGPKKACTLLKIVFDGSKTDVTEIRTAMSEEMLNQFDISTPETITFPSDDVFVTGLYYAPYNNTYEAPAGTLPPVVLLGHGGPTAIAEDGLDLRKQFFTSRGFAVFDVNYRGSTGYGSTFRHALKRQWGIVDRNDMISAAKALIKMKRVDENKICIKGSSAGGYLLLSCLQHSDVFKAAVSMYGVADLIGLAKDSHKFEKGYNEALLGKFPEEINIYEERSPINHIDKLSTPIAFIHGTADTVVPVSQSVEMYEKLKARGITTALMLCENEGHGFRGAQAIREGVEATYYFLCKALGIEPSVQSKIEIVNPK